MHLVGNVVTVQDMENHTNTTKTTYRGTCTCGWKGRTFRDPNAADEAAENHAIRTDQYQGGYSNGRRHTTSVEEVA